MAGASLFNDFELGLGSGFKLERLTLVQGRILHRIPLLHLQKWVHLRRCRLWCRDGNARPCSRGDTSGVGPLGLNAHPVKPQHAREEHLHA